MTLFVVDMNSPLFVGGLSHIMAEYFSSCFSEIFACYNITQSDSNAREKKVESLLIPFFLAYSVMVWNYSCLIGEIFPVLVHHSFDLLGSFAVFIAFIPSLLLGTHYQYFISFLLSCFQSFLSLSKCVCEIGKLKILHINEIVLPCGCSIIIEMGIAESDVIL